MGANRFGRVLGISARIAAEKLREKTAQSAAAPPQPAVTRPPVPGSAVSRPTPTATTVASPSRPSAANYVAGSRRFARGAGRFGASIWRPFAHASGVLWLQITGVFFALFALFFVVHASQVYRTAGWHDRHVIIYSVLAVLFGWFAVSSFWRAQRRQKQG